MDRGGIATARQAELVGTKKTFCTPRGSGDLLLPAEPSIASLFDIQVYHERW